MYNSIDIYIIYIYHEKLLQDGFKDHTEGFDDDIQTWNMMWNYHRLNSFIMFHVLRGWSQHENSTVFRGRSES